MIDYSTFPLFFITTFLMSLSPGPAVFLILGHGMKFGVRGAILGATGIEIMNGLYFLISALGLTALLLAYPLIFQALKWLGIGYLFLTGFQVLFTAKQRALVPTSTPGEKALITQGIMTQAANPKAIIYFGAMLPQFISPEKSIASQFSILGIISCTMEFIILTAYGWFAYKGSKFLPGPTAVLWQDRIAGVCLITVASILCFK